MANPNEVDFPTPAQLGISSSGLLAATVADEQTPDVLRQAERDQAARRAVRAGEKPAGYTYTPPPRKPPSSVQRARMQRLATRPVQVSVPADVATGRPALREIKTSYEELPTPKRSTLDSARDHIVHFTSRSPLLIAGIAIAALAGFILLTLLPSLFESSGGKKP